MSFAHTPLALEVYCVGGGSSTSVAKELRYIHVIRNLASNRGVVGIIISTDNEISVWLV